ncbi:MAG: hypothetical protein IKT58_00115, partial [Oscillospiraceae bacterium]|nr:hypothetical protein [Oscillospiraceae bacterium]
MEENKPSQAAQKYHTLQISGLAETGNQVRALCVPAISRKTYKGLFFRDKETRGVYNFAPIVNIPLLRNLLLFFYVVGYVLRHRKGTDAVICDVLNTTVSGAVLLAGWLTGLQTVGIVTDVTTKRAFRVRNPVKRLASRLSYWLLGSYKKYIFLTEAMNDLINLKHRPYLVSEGHVDHGTASLSNELSDKHSKKVCLYAGSLRRIYGIDYLVQAFLEAGIENAELHVYGAGEYASD